MKAKFAITLGNSNGIGPKIVLKSFFNKSNYDNVITTGLPFMRTSVDHGTAMKIAG